MPVIIAIIVPPINIGYSIEIIYSDIVLQSEFLNAVFIVEMLLENAELLIVVFESIIEPSL